MAARRRLPGFTLVEVLVALAFMALVVPVIAQALKVSSLAAEVSQRKSQAMRIAERVLNETIVTGQWNLGTQQGNEKAGPCLFQWKLRNEPWTALASAVAINTVNGINQTVVSQNNLHVLSVDVGYPAQGQTYYVHLSTIVDITKQVTLSPPPKQ